MHCPLLWLIYTSFTLLPPGYCYTHTYTLEKKQSDHHKTPQDYHMLKVSACKQSIINFTMATSHHCITKHLLLHSHHLNHTHDIIINCITNKECKPEGEANLSLGLNDLPVILQGKMSQIELNSLKQNTYRLVMHAVSEKHG